MDTSSGSMFIHRATERIVAYINPPPCDWQSKREFIKNILAEEFLNQERKEQDEQGKN